MNTVPVMDEPQFNAVSPRQEMNAYETLWGFRDQTLKTLAALFAAHQHELPSQVLDREKNHDLMAAEIESEVVRFITEKIDGGFSVCLHGDYQYPETLRRAQYPIELFYYRGFIGLTETRCISIVGARKCTEEGRKRAAKLARGLVDRGFSIVSGLAAGIDTAAMLATLEAGGNTIGVIGTPINESYPRENASLQERVAAHCLLVSQVPFYRYANEPFTLRRRYFPERNVTMAALSEATIIVEASDTSGSLTQARACLAQGKQLFILNSCFENKSLTWPAYYEKKGAKRVSDFDDIFAALKGPANGANRATLEED